MDVLSSVKLASRATVRLNGNLGIEVVAYSTFYCSNLLLPLQPLRKPSIAHQPFELH